MGAQSDSISETFVPSEQHTAEQKERAKVLLSAGFAAEEVAAMLSVSVETLLQHPDETATPEGIRRSVKAEEWTRSD